MVVAPNINMVDVWAIMSKPSQESLAQLWLNAVGYTKDRTRSEWHKWKGEEGDDAITYFKDHVCIMSKILPCYLFMMII